MPTPRVLLTGGAGFIGSHVLDLLAPTGVHITVYDNLSHGKLAYIESHLSLPNVTVVKADILDREKLIDTTRGHDLVWHLAANTDIINSHDHPERDLEDCAVGTFNVVEAMRRTGVRDILFASSGAVYGNICAEQSVTEDAGPLLPVSTYGAGKIASEAFISSFCHVYGLRAWMYRFGNVIGPRCRGLIAYQVTGARLWRAYFLGLLAQALTRAERVQEGLDAAAEALAVVRDTGEQGAAAELHRVYGELLLARASPDPVAEAEDSFKRALAIARTQQAKSWELRAATSLARLYVQQGKMAKARRLVAPVLEWFTEGHETADVRAARAVLGKSSGQAFQPA